MKRQRLNKDSHSSRIVGLLDEKGPMSHGDIAEALEFSQKEYKYDFNLRKDQYKKGIIKTPPRNNVKLYPFLSRLLAYLSRRSHGAARDNDFIERYKPLIALGEDNKWSITRFGVQALNELKGRDEKEKG